MFVISIVFSFPQRRKILRLYKSFPLVNHKHKKSVNFCLDGGSGLPMLQTRKLTDTTASVFAFLRTT